MKTPKIIVIGNQKGGVGKSTNASQLAHALAELHEFKVVLLDRDAQGTCRDWYRRNSESKCNRLDYEYCPAVPDTQIQKIVESYKGYDFCIFDTAGVIEEVLVFKIADLILIPITPSKADTDGTAPFIELLKAMNQLSKSYVIMNMQDNRSKRPKQIKEDFIRDHQIPFLKHGTSWLESYKKCLDDGITVFDLDKKTTSNQKARNEITNITQEILEILNGNK